MAIEHADFEGVERLAAVTGGATASTFDHPDLAVLGECAKIEEVRRPLRTYSVEQCHYYRFTPLPLWLSIYRGRASISMSVVSDRGIRRNEAF